MSFAYYLPYLCQIHLKLDEESGQVGGFEMASQGKLTCDVLSGIIKKKYAFLKKP